MEAKMEDFDREKIESMRLSLKQVRTHAHHLWQISLAERRQIIGLPPTRADVILAGVAIYLEIMERFGFSELRMSTRGLRYSALL